MADEVRDLWSETLLLTPALAAKWLEEHRYEYQRTPSDEWIKTLVLEIKAGRFRPSDVTLCHLNGHSFLTNGQQRCRAVMEAGVGIPVVAWHVRVKDHDELAAQYVNEDIGRIRPPSQVWNPYRVQELSGLTNKNLNCASAALLMIMNGFSLGSGSQHNPAERSRTVRLNSVREWMPEIQQYFTCIAGADRWVRDALMRKGVMSVGLVTFHHQAVKAKQFWQLVAANDGLRKGDPVKALVDFLLRTPAKLVNAPRYARSVASPWNAFFLGRALHFTKDTDVAADKEILIEGTPYDGKRRITCTFE